MDKVFTPRFTKSQIVQSINHFGKSNLLTDQVSDEDCQTFVNALVVQKTNSTLSDDLTRLANRIWHNSRDHDEADEVDSAVENNAVICITSKDDTTYYFANQSLLEHMARDDFDSSLTNLLIVIKHNGQQIDNCVYSNFILNIDNAESVQSLVGEIKTFLAKDPATTIEDDWIGLGKDVYHNIIEGNLGLAIDNNTFVEAITTLAIMYAKGMQHTTLFNSISNHLAKDICKSEQGG